MGDWKVGNCLNLVSFKKDERTNLGLIIHPSVNGTIGNVFEASSHDNMQKRKKGKLKCIPSSPGDTDSLLSHLKNLMGTSNDELTLEIIAAASGGISSNTDTKHLLTVAADVLAECKPQDLHEARLTWDAL